MARDGARTYGAGIREGRMANFTTYTMSIRGTGSGIQPGVRAVASLFDGATNVGSIYGWDAGVAIPNDSSAAPLTMNVPITLFPMILDVLRHEGPLQITHSPNLGRVVLAIVTQEPVGEDET